jgi:hypothetical protein
MIAWVQPPDTPGNYGIKNNLPDWVGALEASPDHPLAFQDGQIREAIRAVAASRVASSNLTDDANAPRCSERTDLGPGQRLSL